MKQKIKITVGKIFSFFLGIIIRNNDSYKKITQNNNKIQLSVIYILYYFRPKNSGLTTYEEYPLFMTFRCIFFIIVIIINE